MSNKSNVLTNAFANISVTLMSLGLTLGLSFSAIKLIMYAYNYYNPLPKSMDYLVNVFMVNTILDVTIALVTVAIFVTAKISRDNNVTGSGLSKIFFILVSTIFVISSFVAQLSVSEMLTSLYYVCSILFSFLFFSLSLASITVAFMQNKFVKKLNKLKDKFNFWMDNAKNKKIQANAESYLKEMAQNSEEVVKKNKIEQISDAFINIKAHLNIHDPILKSDASIARHILNLEKTVSEITKTTKNETSIADIKSLVFKSLPEIAISYKDFTNEGSFQQNEEHKKLVIESLEQINHYFNDLLSKTQEEKMVEKSSDLSVKLEFAKKRFLNMNQK